MSVKGSRSRCMLEKYLKGPITMQGFILIAITAAEKCTIILDLTKSVERVM